MACRFIPGHILFYMMRLFILLLTAIFSVFSSCIPSEKDNRTSNITIRLNNLPVDTCSIRINHIVTGREIFSKSGVSLLNPIEIPPLVDDIYILVISWPKTFIPHSLYKSKSFIEDESVDLFEWTKPFYYSKKNGDSYTINVDNSIDLEELESNGATLLNFSNENCEECDLSDEYWELYSSFFYRKKLLSDSIKGKYYDFVNNNDLVNAKRAYTEMTVFNTTYKNDEQLDTDIINKISKNVESPVSTFFLFYQLFNNKDFGKYYSVFNQLKGLATETKYYRMIKKQFQNQGK